MKDKNERIRKIKIRDKKTRQRKTLRGEKVEICSHTQERRRRRRKRARKVEEGRERKCENKLREKIYKYKE